MPHSVGLGNHVENQDEIVSNSFDLFSAGSVEKAMGSGYEQEIQLTTHLNDDGPFEFVIPPSSDYIFFPHTRLYIQGKIVTAAGANPVAATAYSTCNLFPQALFKQVDVHVGGCNTSSQDGLYPYKAYFETLFSYSESTKKSHLASCSGWATDTVGQMDTIGAGNTGYTARRNHVAPGKTFDFCVPIHADVLHCPKLIPPQTPIKINLFRMNDNFSLMSAAAEDLKIKLTHMSLFIRKIIPTEAIGLLYKNNLEKKEVILPFSRSILKRETVAAGSTNVHFPLFNGELPRQILLTFVNSQRLDGRKNLNPFQFEHSGVNYVNLRINGMSEPGRPFTPDFENEIVSRELRALYDNTGVLTSDSGFDISKDAFVNGQTFFAWDLTPDHCNGFHIHDKKAGKIVDVDIRFSEGLEAAINVLVYATYETRIKLLNGVAIEANFING